MLWWFWIIFGLILATMELATPGGFFLLFFGIGAVSVGLLALVDLAGPAWVQWLLFSVVSVLSLLLFRGRLLASMHANDWMRPRVDALTDDVATTLEAIAPGSIGRVELRGTPWSARNVGGAPLTKGQRCAVQRVDGLTLDIVPEGAK
jgi:membrane protein implicated in regulation of membrane protease activity